VNDPNREFERIVYPEFPQNSPREFIDPTPYGITPVKPGLTKRGKAGIAVASAVIAGGSLLGWTHYSTQQDAAENKAQELAIKQQELRLKELQILNQQAVETSKTQTALEQARQAKVDACVKANKSLAGRQLGVTYRSVVDDCKAQYETATQAGDDMLSTASTATNTTNSGGPNDFLLVGGGVLALLVAGAARKVTRSNES
jgi:hypothetical protein